MPITYNDIKPYIVRILRTAWHGRLDLGYKGVPLSAVVDRAASGELTLRGIAIELGGIHEVLYSSNDNGQDYEDPTRYNSIDELIDRVLYEAKEILELEIKTRKRQLAEVTKMASDYEAKKEA